VRNVLWAVSFKFIEPIDHLRVTATLIDEASQTITTIAPALVAGDSYQIEFADQIREDDCAVSGHCGQSRLKATQGKEINLHAARLAGIRKRMTVTGITFQVKISRYTLA
jgi:hypothetical protein